MYILSVLNAKGGVAKTTTAIALADYLSIKHKVLLIDIDPQANATMSLLSQDVGQKLKTPTMYNVMRSWADSQERTIKAAILPSGREGLDLVPADLKMETFKHSFKLALPVPSRFIADILKPVKKSYDYVVIDCPADVSIYVESAIKNSDLCIVPSTYDLYGFKAIQIIMQFIMSIRGKKHRGFKVLYTRVKSRATKIQSQMQKYIDVFEQYNAVLPFQVPEEQAVTNAQGEHKSLMLDPIYKRSKARAAYARLAEYVEGEAHV